MEINKTKRNFFREGDIVVDNYNNEYIYIKAKGFDTSVLMKPDGEIIELNRMEQNNVLTFHPEFDPGYIALVFS
ncbi:MAG: hypothetical protein RSE41_00510 [Clostridia bacterium]